MKKTYAIAILLLVGIGIVSTLAFTYDANLTVDSSVYSVTDNGATGSVTKVKVVPVSGNLNKTKIIITLSGQSVDFDMYITLIDADLTGATLTPDSGSATGDAILANGYFEYANCTAGNSWSITIDASSGTGHPGSSVWQDATGLLITLVDS